MLKQHLLTKHRWLVFLLPFVVYLLLGALEPAARRGRRQGQRGLAVPLRLVSAGSTR